MVRAELLRQAAVRSRRRAFTLLELLVVIAVLGIAGALVIPAMGSTGVLRVQAAVRTIVSDITFAQADAMAFQERRAVMFDIEASSYRLVEVPGDTLDPENNTMYDPTRPSGLYEVSFSDPRFGGSEIIEAAFDGNTTLILDDLGSPVASPSGDQPGAGGFVRVAGSGQVFVITVEAFTGRVSVTREGDEDEGGEDEGEGGGEEGEGE